MTLGANQTYQVIISRVIAANPAYKDAKTTPNIPTFTKQDFYYGIKQESQTYYFDYQMCSLSPQKDSNGVSKGSSNNNVIVCPFLECH